MARKKISASTRGRVLIHRGGKSKPRKSTMQIWKDDLQASPEVMSLAWEAAARGALKIEDMTFAFFPDADGKPVRHEMPADFFDQSAHAMRRAFDHFKLDPADPWAWRQMVSYFAFVFFWPGCHGSGAERQNGHRPAKPNWRRPFKLYQGFPICGRRKSWRTINRRRST